MGTDTEAGKTGHIGYAEAEPWCSDPSAGRVAIAIAARMIATLTAENSPAVPELAIPYQATGASARPPAIDAILGENESDTIARG